MPDHRDELDLNQFWNDLLESGTPDSGAVDPNDAETIRHLHLLASAPLPDSARERVWRGLMNSTSTTGPIKEQALNTSTDIFHPGSKSTLNGHSRALAPPAAKPSAHPRRAFTQTWLSRIAVALVLFGSLFGGYRVFGPSDGGSKTPVVVPAVFSDSGTPEASPAGTPINYLESEHPVVGVWYWDHDPCSPGLSEANGNFAIFHADGTYVEYDDFAGVGIGQWRATGERTLEVAAISQHLSIEFADLWEPEKKIPSSLLQEGGYVAGWMWLEVDETGNKLTGTGYYEPRDAYGNILIHIQYGDECNNTLAAVRAKIVDGVNTDVERDLQANLTPVGG